MFRVHKSDLKILTFEKLHVKQVEIEFRFEEDIVLSVVVSDCLEYGCYRIGGAK